MPGDPIPEQVAENNRRGWYQSALTPAQGPAPTLDSGITWRQQQHKLSSIIGTDPGQSKKIEFASFSGADVQIDLAVKLPSAKRTGGLNGTPLLQMKGDPWSAILRVAQIQTLSISSARSKYPVRRLGESHVTAYTSGARTIAGSMIFATGQTDIFTAIASYSTKERMDGKVGPFFVDELPELMVVITAANEYGEASTAALVGIELTNFGTTFSVDDMYNESTYTYVARHYYPLTPDPVAFTQMLNRPRPTAKTPASSVLKPLPNSGPGESESMLRDVVFTLGILE